MSWIRSLGHAHAARFATSSFGVTDAHVFLGVPRRPSLAKWQLWADLC